MVTWRSLLKKYPFNNIAFVASRKFTLLSSLGFKRSNQRHEVFEKARVVALLEGILSGSILDGYFRTFRTWSFTTHREKIYIYIYIFMLTYNNIHIYWPNQPMVFFFWEFPAERRSTFETQGKQFWQRWLMIHIRHFFVRFKQAIVLIEC